MEDMQSQMNAILGNPEMMQQIMAMAQSLNAPAPEEKKAPDPTPGGFTLPDMDLNMIKNLSGFAGQANIDANQRSLLQALRPYLSHERIAKLEKAMRAAKLAGMATSRTTAMVPKDTIKLFLKNARYRGFWKIWVKFFRVGEVGMKVGGTVMMILLGSREQLIIQ